MTSRLKRKGCIKNDNKDSTPFGGAPDKERFFMYNERMTDKTFRDSADNERFNACIQYLKNIVKMSKNKTQIPNLRPLPPSEMYDASLANLDFRTLA